MKVQHIALRPSPEAAECLSLTPELMAACGARYSRNDEGIEAIEAKIDWSDPGKSVDSIFRLMDYGHASIGNMAPVSLFMDGVSLLAAFWMWHFCPCASGQESSSRYIRFNDSKMCSSSDLGFSSGEAERSQHRAYGCYDSAELEWSGLATRDPSVMKLPLGTDTKKIERMRRNYSFDRARVFLPLSARTNVMMVQSARDWVDLCSLLLSGPLKELRELGREILAALATAVPRTLKHAVENDPCKAVWDKRVELASKAAESAPYDVCFSSHGGKAKFNGDFSSIDLSLLDRRANRYGPFEDAVRVCTVDASWKQGSIGELRDLNRHRTGSKSLGHCPNGFMPAADQHVEMSEQVLKYAHGPMRAAWEECRELLSKGDLAGLYLLSLGHTFEWRHVTTLDKWIYTAELRTGLGAHYAYARMVREAWDSSPELQALTPRVYLGTGEPE